MKTTMFIKSVRSHSRTGISKAKIQETRDIAMEWLVLLKEAGKETDTTTI